MSKALASVAACVSVLATTFGVDMPVARVRVHSVSAANVAVAAVKTTVAVACPWLLRAEVKVVVPHPVLAHVRAPLVPVYEGSVRVILSAASMT
jgi:hypothetical protein